MPRAVHELRVELERDEFDRNVPVLGHLRITPPADRSSSPSMRDCVRLEGNRRSCTTAMGTRAGMATNPHAPSGDATGVPGMAIGAISREAARPTFMHLRFRLL